MRDEYGELLRAEFAVVIEGERTAVYLESRGGAGPSSGTRNPDYSKALRLLLARLSAKGAWLEDATVESRVTRDLNHERKQLRLDAPYPIPLEAQDPEDLRLALQRAQRTIGQAPDAQGGNITRRLRLQIAVDASSPEALEEDLTGGIADPTNAGLAGAHSVGSPRGQGFAGDARAIKAIEMRAMQVVTAKLEADNWMVADVSTRESFDLLCRMATRELHVEVKGVTGPALDVLLTSNEVRQAAEWPDTAMGIVVSIDLDRTVDPPRASGGTLHWFEPWDPTTSGVLEGVRYRWRTHPARPS